MAQETWLTEKRLSDLSQLGVQFVGRSGMEDATSSGIMRGRPFGGVSIAWSPDLNHVIKPLVNYRHKRVVCVEMSAEPHPILLVTVYMPFYKAAKRRECMAETVETIAMIEEILADHPGHKVILGGDFNTEFADQSPFDVVWKEFIRKHDLICCDRFVNGNTSSVPQWAPTAPSNAGNSNNYTYIHNSLNQKKWNDHFFVSASIASMTDGHEILDVGDNTSDHLPIMLRFTANIHAEPPAEDPPVKAPSLKWEKCSEEQKLAYAKRLRELLEHSPAVLTPCNVAHCQNVECIASIQNEYDELISLITKADSILPRHKPGVQKHWWTEELTLLKSKNIDIHRLWQREGKPHSGVTNAERLRVKAAYRQALKAAQRAPKQACWNKLHGTFASKSTNEFWKSWRQLYNKAKSDLHTVVNGVSTKEEIADSFKSHFVKVSLPNNQQRVDQLENSFKDSYEQAVNSHSNCSCSNHSISLENVIDAVFSLKKGKSADEASISAEHFFNAPLPLFDRLQCLLNKMLLHGCVPRQFQHGTIVPIVKDRHGDKGDLNNYRGITIAPISSKIFEHALRILFQPYLTTSNYQYGFKRKSSTSHAIFSLKETINYYTSHGSNVYCSFLDASKAFDRLVHAGLFLKLLQRGIPLIFLETIRFWYSNLQCRVRWGDTLSDWFDIKAGVRQGGVLSPTFYCIYIDELVEVLSTLGIGCHLRNIFLSILLYADDMALMAPSLKGLQKLLTATENYCLEWDIMLNAKKSKNMSFGNPFSLPPLQLDGKNIDWVESWPYLGVTIRSHTSFNCCIDDKVKAFYRSANAILRIEGRSNEMVMLELLESHCLSILTYAIDVINVNDRDERRRLRVAYNSMYRKVFDYRDWESVTELQHTLQRPTWEELVDRRSKKFLTSVSRCNALKHFL